MLKDGRTFKVFGSPWSPEHGLWGFGYKEPTSPEESLWNDIPSDTDVRFAAALLYPRFIFSLFNMKLILRMGWGRF